MKFLVPNYSCLQNPCLGGYRLPDPRFLCPLSSTEFVEPPTPEQNSWVRHCSDQRRESYAIGRRLLKWWHSLLYFLIDLASVYTGYS